MKNILFSREVRTKWQNAPQTMTLTRIQTLRGFRSPVSGFHPALPLIPPQTG